MNAIEMLKSDHAKVKNLFEQYDAAAAQASRKQDLERFSIACMVSGFPLPRE